MPITLPYNEFVKKQNDKNTTIPLRKGIINAVYPESWTADVQIIGSVQTIVKSVPISLALAIGDIRVGDKCKLDVFDESNQIDIVVAYTYGRTRYTKYNNGFVSLLGDGTEKTIRHGLGGIPSIYDINTPVFGGGTGSSAKNFFISSAADDTFIYVTGSVGLGSVSGIFWFAALIE